MITPSQLTLAGVKNSSIANIAGVCVSSPQFVQQVNEAVQRLMSYGSFWNTVVKGRVCIEQGCVTWPRWVGTLLATKICGMNRQISGGWAEFMPLTPTDCQWWFSNRNRTNAGAPVIDDGIACVFRNIPCGKAFPIQVHTRLQTDVGKTITFYGIDQNGQEMMTKDVLGNWTKGVTVTLGIPDQITTVAFREVTDASKDPTVGPVDVYCVTDQVDPVTSAPLLLDMAHYQGSETRPRYRHTSLKGCGWGGNGNACVEFLAKLAFIPVVNDTDIVQIDNIAALKYMIRAVRLEESGQDDQANKCQAAAIHELNRELNEKLPFNQIPFAIESFGTALPALAGIGRII